jgi:hypothetical protein
VGSIFCDQRIDDLFGEGSSLKVAMQSLQIWLKVVWCIELEADEQFEEKVYPADP